MLRQGTTAISAILLATGFVGACASHVASSNPLPSDSTPSSRVPAFSWETQGSASSLPPTPVTAPERVPLAPPLAKMVDGGAPKTGARPALPPPARCLDGTLVADEIASLRADDPQAPKWLFDHARKHYDAREWDRAAILFRRVAVEHAKSPQGIPASQQYLECLNLLTSRGNAACFDDMTRDVPLLLGLHCDDAQGKPREECHTMTLVQTDLLRLQAEHAARAAERAQSKVDIYRAGDNYFQIFRTYCLSKKVPSGVPKDCATYAFNGAKLFLQSSRRDRAQSILTLMSDPKYSFQNDALTQRLACTLASDAGICP